MNEKREAAWDCLIDALNELATKHRGNGQHDYNLGCSLRALAGLAKGLREGTQKETAELRGMLDEAARAG